ncbi:hypothetical protein Cni_G08267 [Canna indica]|uniref:Hexosyltransferase n=1 Tax=Canna indica TaxID=4628 RepID=A0AAQ3Q5K7_9LILI|nr:hypothetical protein Cni_G08267 [Canna indica]
MASFYDPSAHASGSGLSRRPASSERPRPPVTAPLHADIDPPPRPRPFLQSLALGLIVLLGCLQFFPATHFRDPSDPYRNWIPINYNRSQPIEQSTNPKASENEDHNAMRKQDKEVGRLDVFSSMDCLDLRVLAVLANSTLSNSRHPERIFFHFFVPENEDKKLSYYKLKVLLPHSNIQIIGLKEVKKKLMSPTLSEELLGPLLPEILPFVIPSVDSSVKKFLYVSPSTIIEGHVEEIFDIDLGTHAIAAAEDCGRRLGDYVNTDVLSAIQRTAAKTWVSNEPYDKDACLPDLNLLLLDARKLENNLTDAILWWTKVLDLKPQRVNDVSIATALAFYQRYAKLPFSWKLHESTSIGNKSEAKFLTFDGPTKVCSQDNDQQQRSNDGNIWNKYITPNFEAILSHEN